MTVMNDQSRVQEGKWREHHAQGQQDVSLQHARMLVRTRACACTTMNSLIVQHPIDCPIECLSTAGGRAPQMGFLERVLDGAIDGVTDGVTDGVIDRVFDRVFGGMIDVVFD